MRNLDKISEIFLTQGSYIFFIILEGINNFNYLIDSYLNASP